MSGKPGLDNRSGRTDARSTRTRLALLAAFNRLFLSRRERNIDLRLLTRKAGVGRSTFYNHFSSADDLLLEALRSPFSVLAEAAAGRGDAVQLECLLEHFWAKRHHGRDVLAGRLRVRTENLLADMVQQRLDDRGLVHERLTARIMAGALLSPVRAWLSGETHCEPPKLAVALQSSSRAIIAAIQQAQATEMNPRPETD